MSTLAHMPYLNACLTERCAEVRLTRTFVGTHFIPDCSQVFVHTYTLHRNLSYFSPFPETFWLDRWLPRSQRVYLGPTDNASCCARTVGIYSLFDWPDKLRREKLGTDGTAYRYVLRPPTFPRADSVQDYFVMKTGPLPVVLIPRH